MNPFIISRNSYWESQGYALIQHWGTSSCSIIPYLVAQKFELRPGDYWRLTPQCEKYMDSYLDVSWRPVLSHIPEMALMEGYLDAPQGHVRFCIPKMTFPTPFQCLKNTSPLAKFDWAFRKAYQAQKFFKVPDPWLRSVLRETITKRVISRYRDYLTYLKNHPELEKHVSHGCSTTNELKEMLGELFEGWKVFKTSNRVN